VFKLSVFVVGNWVSRSTFCKVESLYWKRIVDNTNARDLDDLYQRLEMSLHCVQARKEEILIDELEELNRRERCLYEENMNLHSMISTLESSRVAPAGHDFCFESMKYSEAEDESSEAAISVPNISLQLNLADSSQS